MLSISSRLYDQPVSITHQSDEQQQHDDEDLEIGIWTSIKRHSHELYRDKRIRALGIGNFNWYRYRNQLSIAMGQFGWFKNHSKPVFDTPAI